MKGKTVFILMIIFTGGLFGIPQESEPKEMNQPVFVKATCYPTVSLSRYDYNNDLDRQEMRVYIQLREKNIQGDPVKDAVVTVNGTVIQYDPEKEDYRQRIHITRPEYYPRKIEIDIRRSGHSLLHTEVTFPGWVRISHPRPRIHPVTDDLKIGWIFSSDRFPLILHIYDYKKRKEMLIRRKEADEAVIFENGKIPHSTILRIWITSDWFFKKYLRGDHIVRGSEINVMPWSQVFIRTGKGEQQK